MRYICKVSRRNPVEKFLAETRSISSVQLVLIAPRFRPT